MDDRTTHSGEPAERSESSPPLGAQRLCHEDARAVIALWAARQGLSDEPAIDDLAEGLDISPEDVRRLLAEVQARRAERRWALALEQARLQQELALLAQEQNRLALDERQLAQVRHKRARVWAQRARLQHHARLSSRRPAKPRRRFVRELGGTVAAWLLVLSAASYLMTAR